MIASSHVYKKHSSCKSNNKLKDYFKSNDGTSFYASNREKNSSSTGSDTLQNESLSGMFLPAASLLQTDADSTSADILGSGEVSFQQQKADCVGDLLIKKKMSKLEKKMQRELLAQEKKLKKKNKLLETLAVAAATVKTKTLKTKRKKIRPNPEEINELVFEIVGDDGFYAQSKDINSEFYFLRYIDECYKQRIEDECVIRKIL